MNSSIFQSEVIEMKTLSNLFIELTAKFCNQRCKECYIDFPQYKKIQDFISIDTIKTALNDTMSEGLECIYLTGAEPMTHPDFNAILRLCLKRCDVCICTNGSFINEKKARFLKKVEDETTNEIIFKISLAHFDEIKNDDIRYRGAYRHSIFAIKHLIKYNFNPVIAFSNYYNLSEKEIVDGLFSVFEKNNLNLDFSNIQISRWHNKDNSIDEEIKLTNNKLDCAAGRVLTQNGIFSCMFLANDYRGRCGSSFRDYNKKVSLETNYCCTCMKSREGVFGIDFSKFI